MRLTKDYLSVCVFALTDIFLSKSVRSILVSGGAECRTLRSSSFFIKDDDGFS